MVIDLLALYLVFSLTGEYKSSYESQRNCHESLPACINTFSVPCKPQCHSLRPLILLNSSYCTLHIPLCSIYPIPQTAYPAYTPVCHVPHLLPDICQITVGSSYLFLVEYSIASRSSVNNKSRDPAECETNHLMI